MKHLALLAAPLLCLSSATFAADLGPYPEEKETYERPPIVDRKIVEHHHYYHQAPTVYREKRVYVEPRVYEEPVYRYRSYPRRYAYLYRDWRPSHFPRRHWAQRHRNWY